MSDKTSLFEWTFLNKFVEILTPIYRKHIQGNEEGVSDETIPIVLQGYLINIDKERLYLGDTPDEINQAVFKEDVRIIRVVKEDNSYDEIMDSMPDGKKENMN